MNRISVAGPSITDLEIEYVTDAARNAWYERWNEYNERFEAAFAAYVGVPYAISLPSCTSALHLSMAALGVGPGDEVIVPDITWIASAVPSTYVGARPVFCDIDPVTWCVSAETIERAITPRTKAIVAVELYGSMPNWTEVLDMAARHGIPVIEDAAEAVGSEFMGRKAGAFGATGVFSFHGSKTMSTGEGGMLVTSDRAAYDRCVMLRDQGRNPATRTRLWNEEIGFKYRMSAVQAALGLAQTERMPELLAKKREIFGWYAARLGEMRCLTLNAEPEGVLNSYWMTTVIVDEAMGVDKEQLMARLDAVGIDTRPFFYPLSSLPAFAHLPDVRSAEERNPVAYSLSRYGINLPSGLNLTETDVDRVCAEVREALPEPARV